MGLGPSTNSGAAALRPAVPHLLVSNLCPLAVSARSSGSGLRVGRSSLVVLFGVAGAGGWLCVQVTPSEVLWSV